MVNTCIVMGRLTADPVLRTTQAGKSVVHFCVACDRTANETDFINCVAWDSSAKFIHKYFLKGTMIAVEGSLRSRQYEDKNGHKVKTLEVSVSRASFCGEKRRETKVADPDEIDPQEFLDGLPF